MGWLFLLDSFPLVDSVSQGFGIFLCILPTAIMSTLRVELTFQIFDLINIELKSILYLLIYSVHI